MASPLPIPAGVERAVAPATGRAVCSVATTTGRGLLAHERAFLALYAAVVVRLAAAATRTAWHEASWWLALAAASLALAAAAEPTRSAGAWRARLGAYLVLMNVAYLRLARVFAVTGGVRRDAALRRADSALFGAPVPLLVDRWHAPLLSDLLSGCYLLLFPYLTIACVRHVVRWRRAPVESVRFYEGLFTVYAIGFAGYLLVPAQGMWLDAPGAFAHPIVGGWLTALNARVVAAGSSRVDVFPSLHVAVSAFILGFHSRLAPRWVRFAPPSRWWLRVAALPTLALWFSTVYLGYHYGVDVIAGFATGAIGIAVAFRRSLGDAVAIK